MILVVNRRQLLSGNKLTELELIMKGTLVIFG
jgi:hypothetical protein